jgi:uncharacterized membrane protein YeaQ/YmgE (transglycosylase-associated protein family)
MPILILILAMLAVGLLIGFLAGPLWKGQRPIGAAGDFLVAIAVAVVVGLFDWFVIPAMGFSTTMRNLAVALEPALGALLVLWLVRVARR